MAAERERPREAADVEKWIGEARQGDREALGRLLDICRHYLLLVANQELAPALWAKTAPSDIVQESLMEAGHTFPRFHGGTDRSTARLAARHLAKQRGQRPPPFRD